MTSFVVKLVIVFTVAASVAVALRNWERTRRVEIKLIIEPVEWIEPMGEEQAI